MSITPKAWLFTYYQHNDLQVALQKIEPHDIIIAVDSGADLLLKYNIIPHHIIGDFDSIDNNILTKNNHNSTSHKEKLNYQQILANTNIIELDKNKNETDTEIAIDFCIKNGYKEIYLVNSMQNRLDHILGVISTIENSFDQGIQIRVITAWQEVFLAKKSQELRYLENTVFSLCPLSEVVSGINTHNCRYPLKHESLYRNKTRGISNVINSNNAHITYNEGKLLVIVQTQSKQSQIFQTAEFTEQFNAIKA